MARELKGHLLYIDNCRVTYHPPEYLKDKNEKEITIDGRKILYFWLDYPLICLGETGRKVIVIAGSVIREGDWNSWANWGKVKRKVSKKIKGERRLTFW